MFSIRQVSPYNLNIPTAQLFWLITKSLDLISLSMAFYPAVYRYSNSFCDPKCAKQILLEPDYSDPETAVLAGFGVWDVISHNIMKQGAEVGFDL